MPPEVLGRTNRVFPATWLRPMLPDNPDDADRWTAHFLAGDSPLDLSAEPGFWGGKLRGFGGTLIGRGTSEFASAPDAGAAAERVQAQLIEYLSCVGRDSVDVFFLPVRRAVEEFQITGALDALEWARSEGLVRHLGLWVGGPEIAAIGVWQFHDAFELLLVRDALGLERLGPMAKERRVGIVIDGIGVEGPYCRIRPVASEADFARLV